MLTGQNPDERGISKDEEIARRAELEAAADDVTIPRHEFSVEHELHLFLLDMCEIRCPDCDRTAYPDDLGSALDWALGHDCNPDAED